MPLFHLFEAAKSAVLPIDTDLAAGSAGDLDSLNGPDGYFDGEFSHSHACAAPRANDWDAHDINVSCALLYAIQACCQPGHPSCACQRCHLVQMQCFVMLKKRYDSGIKHI